MIDASTPVKTAEGQAELLTRRLRVSQRHRTVLLLVDGQRPEGMVRDLALQAGVPATCFDELVELGLITAGERASPAYAPAERWRPDGPSSVLHSGQPLRSTTALPTRPATREPTLDSEDGNTLLPSSGLLPPDSVIDPTRGEASTEHASWFAPEPGAAIGDAAFLLAREVMMRAVRTEAPVSGSLTLRRLRRARNRTELAGLLGEVETRISKPFRSLVATQTLESVRELLARPPDWSQASP